MSGLTLDASRALEQALCIAERPSWSPHRLFVRGGVTEQWPGGSFDVFHMQERKTGAARGASPRWLGFDERDEAVAREIVKRWNAYRRAVQALGQIAVLAEYGTSGPDTKPACKSEALPADKATALRGSISEIARGLLRALGELS